MKNKIRIGFAAAFTVFTLSIMPVQAGTAAKGSTSSTFDSNRNVPAKLVKGTKSTTTTISRTADADPAGNTSESTTIINVNFSSFSANTAVTTQVPGVIFSLVGGPDASGPPTTSTWSGWLGLLTNSTHGGAYPTANILRATFVGIATTISFNFNNAGSGGGGNGNSFYTAFDSSGNVLQIGSLNGLSGQLVTLSASGVHTLEFNNNSGGSNSWWFGIGSLHAVVTAVNPPPTIASVSPTYGWQFGGTAFTLTGTNFTGATSVTIGGVAATNLVVVSATQITAVTPSSSTSGAKDVVVTTPAGSFTAVASFTYKPDCNNNGIDDATDIAGSIVTRVAGFNVAESQPRFYTENGITFTSGQQHVHLIGNYIRNHNLCCTTPIVITATEPLFTLKSIDVLAVGSTVLVGSNGASVTLSSSGAKNFGTTFQNVAWVRWEENGGNSYFDNVAIEVVGPGVPDCNGNGIPDSCELADGSAVDQNRNGVPDSCDPFPVLRLTTNAAACNTVGSTVTVDATLSGVLNSVVAGQLLLTWDVSKLSFAAVLPGDAPYTTAYALNQQSGTIMILASTTAGGTGTTAASAVVSRIQFTVIGGSCSGTGNEVDFFTFGPMVTEFTDGYGGATVPTLLNSAGFVVDDGAPVLSNVPADVVMNASAGMGSFANVALTPPTATDACAPGLTASSSRNDGQPLGAAFPVGTTTVTWSATDPCGNVTRATTRVTVYNYNTGDFAVSYGGSYPASSSRGLTLDIHGSNGNNARSVSAAFNAGTASFSITDLAIANYDCVSIRDTGHSLRRRVAMSVVGTDWSATATLIAGDLNGNDVIDVVDWGMYIVGNSNADLDGNGSINSTDGAIIISNFGKQSDAVCGGALMGPPDPISAISVAELVERGLTDLIGADLNNDGWLDMEDVRMASN